MPAHIACGRRRSPKWRSLMRIWLWKSGGQEFDDEIRSLAQRADRAALVGAVADRVSRQRQKRPQNERLTSHPRNRSAGHGERPRPQGRGRKKNRKIV